VSDVTAPSPTNTDRSAETNPEAEKRCGACGHPLAGHDGISARYCAATIANRSTRGCVCAPSTATTMSG
jgi:hypothetical protein